LDEELRVGAPKDRMVIVCCGCGEQTDLSAVTRLVDTHPTCITYRATCSCGFTHMIRVTRT
jgi:hypothetical protein